MKNSNKIILTIGVISAIAAGLFFFTSCENRSYGKGHESKVHGMVISISDGDTYDILVNGNKKIRIRMYGIDAPEKGMPFYKVSKKYLGSLCFKKNVRIEITDTDKYGRTVARTYLDDGRELGLEMIKAGYAWHFKKYSSDADLAEAEITARNNKLGLWADPRPIPPWEIRKLHREGISTKDSFKITN